LEESEKNPVLIKKLFIFARFGEEYLPAMGEKEKAPAPIRCGGFGGEMSRS
jgi:hypothetical protein